MLNKMRELTAKTYRITDDEKKHEIRVTVAHDEDAEDTDVGFRSKITISDAVGHGRILFKDTDPDDIDVVLRLVADAADVIRCERDAMPGRLKTSEQDGLMGVE